MEELEVPFATKYNSPVEPPVSIATSSIATSVVSSDLVTRISDPPDFTLVKNAAGKSERST